MKTTSFFIALLLFTGIAMLSSCSATRKSGKMAKKEMGTDVLLKQMAAQRYQPEWFSARANVNYEDDSQSFSASASIKMRRDSLLWVSIKKLGFELARVQVTRDSVYVLDRINNEYAVEGMDYLTEAFGLPAGLREAQDFILGNPVFVDSKGLEVETMGPSYHIFGRGLKVDSDYWVEAGSFLTRKMSFKDKESGQLATILLEEYEPASGQQKFSYLRNLELDSQYSGKSRVALKFSKIDTEIPKSIRFEIPDRYTRTK